MQKKPQLSTRQEALLQEFNDIALKVINNQLTELDFIKLIRQTFLKRWRANEISNQDYNLLEVCSRTTTWLIRNSLTDYHNGQFYWRNITYTRPFTVSPVEFDAFLKQLKQEDEAYEKQKS